MCKLSCAHSIRQRGSSPCPQRLPKKQQPLPRTGSPRPVHSLKRRRRSLTAQAGRPSSLPPGRGGSEPGRVPPRAGTGRKAAGSSAWLRPSAGQRQRGAEPPPAGRPENGKLASPLLREGEPARRTPPGISPLIRAVAGSPVRRRCPSGGARRGRRSRGAPGLPRRERPPGPRAAAGLTARPPLRRPYPQDVVALGAPAGDLDALRGAHGRARAAARLPHKAPRTGDVALAPSLSLPLPLPPGSGAGEWGGAGEGRARGMPGDRAAAPPGGQPRHREEAAAVRWPRRTASRPLRLWGGGAPWRMRAAPLGAGRETAAVPGGIS